jgi:hypothetical protein
MENPVVVQDSDELNLERLEEKCEKIFNDIGIWNIGAIDIKLHANSETDDPILDMFRNIATEPGIFSYKEMDGKINITAMLPDLSKIPEDSKYRVVEGFIAYNAYLRKDAITPSKSWWDKISRAIKGQRGRIRELVEQRHVYKFSFEKYLENYNPI